MRQRHLRRFFRFKYRSCGSRTHTEKVYTPNAPNRFVIITWEYDSTGQLIHCTEAKGTHEQKDTHHVYNSFGQKESTIWPNGITLNYVYDDLGRLISEASSDQSIYYSYAYDIKDRLLSSKDNIQNTETLRAYDTYGRMISETLANGAILRYQYDLLDRVTELTLPDHSSIRYGYDPYGLTSVIRIRDDQVLYSHTYLDIDLSGKVNSETCL